MRILLIEDEMRLASFVQQGLRQAGHVADVAHSGPEGLERAAATAYDVILLDMMLPGQNGLDVLRNLREFNLAAVPVIILSALSDTTHVIRGLDAGAVDYLRKPFELDELLARLRAVDRQRATPGAAPLRLADLEVDPLHRGRDAGRPAPEPHQPRVCAAGAAAAQRRPRRHENAHRRESLGSGFRHGLQRY